MDFFQGASLVATLTAKPYTFTLNNVAAGNYVFTAVATDNRGLVTTSSAVNITVTSGAAQLFFIYTDQLNTPRAITDQTNKVVWRWDNQDPFGANVPDEDPDGDGIKFTCNLRFPGQYADRGTGVNYNYFRDYDSNTGRYIESDPIGLFGGLNTYLYIGGNPISVVDPLGLVDPYKYAPRPSKNAESGGSGSLTMCEIIYLNQTYGNFGGFITDLFNVQQFIPGLSNDFYSGGKIAIEAFVVKAGTPQFLKSVGSCAIKNYSGTILSDIGASSLAAAGTLSDAFIFAAATFTPFATVALT